MAGEKGREAEEKRRGEAEPAEAASVLGIRFSCPLLCLFSFFLATGTNLSLLYI